MKAIPKHWIVDLSYSRNVLECSCGETMPALQGLLGESAWHAHRRAMGVPVRSLGNNPIRKGRVTA